MTHDKQPVTLTEGCFGVTRGGEGVPQEVVGPVMFSEEDDHSLFSLTVGAPLDKCWFPSGQWDSLRKKHPLDIVRTFPTRAAAEAYLRGEPEGKTLAELDVKPGDVVLYVGVDASAGNKPQKVRAPSPDIPGDWLFEGGEDYLSLSDRGPWKLVSRATPTPDPADQAELIASLRQVIADMEDRGGIDWEQRRWDAMLAAMQGLCMNNAFRATASWKDPSVPHAVAAEAIALADALISAARGETQ